MSNNRPQICRNCGQLMGTQDVCPYCGARRNSPVGYVKSLLRGHRGQSVTTVKSIMVFCGIIFLLTLFVSVWLGGVSSIASAVLSPDRRALLLMGITGPFVFQGYWWGPVTSVFLHIGLIHIGFNLYALNVVGPLIERTLGSAATWNIFLISGASGALLTSFVGNHAAGASGAIFGLIGAGIVISYRLGSGMQDPVLRTLLTWAGLTFFIGLMPGLNLDNWGHFGGFVMGAVLALIWTYLRRNALFQKLQPPLALILIGVVVASYASLMQVLVFGGSGLLP